MWDLREHDSQSTMCCAIISQWYSTFNCVSLTKAGKRQRRGLFPFGPHWCDWTELFMCTIEFPLGGQIDLTCWECGWAILDSWWIDMDRGPQEYWQSCWWLKAFVNIQAYKSERHPVVNLNTQPAQHSLSRSTVRWRAKVTCDRQKHESIDKFNYI